MLNEDSIIGSRTASIISGKTTDFGWPSRNSSTYALWSRLESLNQQFTVDQQTAEKLGHFENIHDSIPFFSRDQQKVNIKSSEHAYATKYQASWCQITSNDNSHIAKYNN